MTTFSQVIERTRRRLMTVQREPINTLAGPVTAGDATFTFNADIRFVENSRLSVGLEDVYVTGVATGGGSATVVRGVYGSVAASHSAGDQVLINPAWSNWDVAQAVNDEIADLSSPVNGLFRVRSVEFDFQPQTSGYALTGLSDFIDVWRVRFNEPGPEDDWKPIHPSMWRIDNAADTTDFASGQQIVLKAGGSPGQKVRVSYRAAYDQLTSPSDDVTSVAGLHDQAHDILSIGAAIRLLSGLEAQRALTTSQPDPRRAEEVPPRTAAAALVPLLEQRKERILAERERLAAQFPKALSV